MTPARRQPKVARVVACALPCLLAFAIWQLAAGLYPCKLSHDHTDGTVRFSLSAHNTTRSAFLSSNKQMQPSTYFVKITVSGGAKAEALFCGMLELTRSQSSQCAVGFCPLDSCSQARQCRLPFTPSVPPRKHTCRSLAALGEAAGAVAPGRSAGAGPRAAPAHTCAPARSPPRIGAWLGGP